MERHFAVIGTPIAHSLSPLMHNAGFKHCGINASYTRFQVNPSELGEAVKGLKVLGFEGWNVTLPHKEEIISYLDHLTAEAREAGAVNTVKVEDGGVLIGHNTDGKGFLKSITQVVELTAGQKAIILGAGGAAKSIALALANEGLAVHILNRTEAKAEELAQSIQSLGKTVSWGRFAAGEWLHDAALVVQTTSLGLKNDPYPFSLQGIQPETVVADIIFNPWETPFLKEAKDLGCSTLNGLGMLLYQGALAWDFWFGREAPIAVMEEALLAHFRKDGLRNNLEVSAQIIMSN